MRNKIEATLAWTIILGVAALAIWALVAATTHDHINYNGERHDCYRGSLLV